MSPMIRAVIMLWANIVLVDEVWVGKHRRGRSPRVQMCAVGGWLQVRGKR